MITITIIVIVVAVLICISRGQGSAAYLTTMIFSSTVFPLGPNKTDVAICVDTGDVQPNNSHYMNSITRVYSPAWWLMGAVKQTLISQCVRTVNDQH